MTRFPRYFGNHSCRGGTTRFYQPYLVAHHIQSLAKAGDDVVEDAIALRPNCHRDEYNGETKSRVRNSRTLGRKFDCAGLYGRAFAPAAR